MKGCIIIFLTFLIYSCSSGGSSEDELTTIVNDSTIFLQPFGMCSDPAGNLYIADAGHNQIKKVDTEGNVTVFAGNGESGYQDGPSEEAMFNYPSGICTDGVGNFYIAGFGGQNIRKISSDGMVSTIAGTGEEGYRDGPGNQALFSSPRGICIDSKGNLYVGDCWNHRIRKISPDGNVSTFAGGGKRGELVVNDWKDGQDTAARFDAPCGMAIDENDNIYVADANNNSIRRISIEGKVETLAGFTGRRASLDGRYDKAVLNCPTELVVDRKGNVYFSDTYGDRIRKIDDDNVTTVIKLDSLASPRGITLTNNRLAFIEHTTGLIKQLND